MQNAIAFSSEGYGGNFRGNLRAKMTGGGHSDLIFQFQRFFPMAKHIVRGDAQSQKLLTAGGLAKGYLESHLIG